MSFSFVVGYNIIAGMISMIAEVCIGSVLLKEIPSGRKKHEWRKIFFVIVLELSTAVAGALCYEAGFLRQVIIKLLASYVTLLEDTVCIRLLFGGSFRACWYVVVFSGIAADFAQDVCFVTTSKEIFYMTVKSDSIEYVFRSIVIGPVVFILLLFILHKMQVERAFRQWMERGGIWRWGMVILSAYPVLTMAVSLWFINSGMHIGRSEMLSVFMMGGLLLILHYMGREEAQQKELREQQLNIRQQNTYIETLEGMQEEMRRFRHDYKNMMSGMYLKAKEGNITEITDFIQDMTEDFEEQIGGQIRKMSQLRNIYMTEVKGLLLTKLAEMEKDGIHCELEVLHPFYGTDMKATDLCRCLGILIDNGMDEVRGKEDGQIHIMLSSQDGYTTFRVKNTLYHEVDFHKIWQQGYSTKSSGRGIGLASYKKIVDGYVHVLTASEVRDGFFIQELKIQESR